MRRTLLAAKLHRLHVTHAERDYEGSIAIDARLLAAAGVLEYERVEVYNVTNGERFGTYAILADEDSGVVSINGAAAHKAQPGDLVIVCSYATLDDSELVGFKPRLVYVDARNRITRTRNVPAMRAAGSGSQR